MDDSFASFTKLDLHQLISNPPMFVILYLRGAAYNCSRLFRILAHAELFGIFHLFTLFLEEFYYTARVQHALVAVERI